jgi:hypothetical protein
VESELEWKVLAALLRSTLVTNSDLDVVQVIAEHMAFDAYDEKGDPGGTRGDGETSAE